MISQEEKQFGPPCQPHRVLAPLSCPPSHPDPILCLAKSPGRSSKTLPVYVGIRCDSNAPTHRQPTPNTESDILLQRLMLAAQPCFKGLCLLLRAASRTYNALLPSGTLSQRTCSPCLPSSAFPCMKPTACSLLNKLLAPSLFQWVKSVSKQLQTPNLVRSFAMTCSTLLRKSCAPKLLFQRP